MIDSTAVCRRGLSQYYELLSDALLRWGECLPDLIELAEVATD